MTHATPRHRHDRCRPGPGSGPGGRPAALARLRPPRPAAGLREADACPYCGPITYRLTGLSDADTVTISHSCAHGSANVIPDGAATFGLPVAFALARRDARA